MFHHYGHESENRGKTENHRYISVFDDPSSFSTSTCMPDQSHLIPAKCRNSTGYPPADMRRFSSANSPRVVRMTPPRISPRSDVKPNPRIDNMPSLNIHPVTTSPGIPWQKLPHIRTDKLPEKPTDIKGIDTAGHDIFSRKQIFGKIPTLLSGKYFTATFIPAGHVISQLRKSNVAYTFTNYGSPSLNDQNLQRCFAEYRGKYKSLEFFKRVHSPMGTAVSRSIFRKLVKRALHSALHEVVPDTKSEVEKVSGIFHFKFRRYPTPTERTLMRKDVRHAVTKLYTNTAFQKSVSQISRQQSQAYPHVRMLARDIKVENVLGAERVPGYYPKLPFLPSAPRRTKR